jgi:hypothetical protein
MLVMKSLRGLAFGAPGLDQKFWPEFNARLLLVIFASLMLLNPGFLEWLLETVVFTLLQILVNIAVVIVKSVMVVAQGNIPAGNGDVVAIAINEASDILSNVPQATEVSLIGLRDSILQLVRGIQMMMMSGVAFSYRLMEVGGFWPSVGGFILLIIFVINAIAFPFAILDSVFRMAYMLALAPVFLVAFVFPVSRKYVKTAFNNLLGTGVQMCFLSMYLSFSTILLFSYLYTSGAGNMYRAEDIKETADNVVESYSAMTPSEESSTPLLLLILLSIYLFRLNGKVSKLANDFANNFGPDVFSQVKDAIMGLVKKGLIIATGVVGVVAAKGVAKGAAVAKNTARKGGHGGGQGASQGGNQGGGQGGGQGGNQGGGQGGNQGGNQNQGNQP